MKSKIFTIGILIVVAIITTLNPLYPNEQLLQHLGTIVIAIPLVVDLKKNNLPLYVFICISIFVLFHIIGARYIYSYVPYNIWFKKLFAVDLNLLFDFKRNHFDRLIHFLFGFLWFPYFYFTLSSCLKQIDNRLIIIITWMFIQTASMFYELFEWTLTLLMTSDAAEYYNGQQGDIWDAHKDMALALLGSTCIASYEWIKNYFIKNSIRF